jgi:RimJ/RimL family protein N-acetyltransferase
MNSNVPHPAKPPAAVTLIGRDVRLVPLDPAIHSESLWSGAGGPKHAELWTYLTEGPFDDRESFDRALGRRATSLDRIYFAVVETGSDRALGYAALMRADIAHGVIEVGSILYTPALQQTRGGTEAMYLLAQHVFEDLGYRRYEWKCNALNIRSRRAALRLGFTFEGIFRQHMIVKGLNRDTAWYSMLDSEWPARKAGFELWLAPENFDASGAQKRRPAIRAGS